MTTTTKIPHASPRVAETLSPEVALADEYAANVRQLEIERADQKSTRERLQILRNQDTDAENRINELVKRQHAIHAQLTGTKPR